MGMGNRGLIPHHRPLGRPEGHITQHFILHPLYAAGRTKIRLWDHSSTAAPCTDHRPLSSLAPSPPPTVSTAVRVQPYARTSARAFLRRTHICALYHCAPLFTTTGFAYAQKRRAQHITCHAAPFLACRCHADTRLPARAGLTAGGGMTTRHAQLPRRRRAFATARLPAVIDDIPTGLRSVTYRRFRRIPAAFLTPARTTRLTAHTHSHSTYAAG